MRGTHYEIRVKESLGEKWADWFDGMAIIPQDNDETLLAGTIPDQSALHGVIGKIRDLNLELLSMSRINSDPPNCELDRSG